MYIKIQVFGPKAYTKTGKRRKTAQPNMGFAFVDVEPTTPGSVDKFLAEVAEKLKKSYHAFGSPYVFSHITATNSETGEPAYIFETVDVNGTDLQTSPIKLLEILNA